MVFHGLDEHLGCCGENHVYQFSNERISLGIPVVASIPHFLDFGVSIILGAHSDRRNVSMNAAPPSRSFSSLLTKEHLLLRRLLYSSAARQSKVFPLITLSVDLGAIYTGKGCDGLVRISAPVLLVKNKPNQGRSVTGGGQDVYEYAAPMHGCTSLISDDTVCAQVKHVMREALGLNTLFPGTSCPSFFELYNPTFAHFHTIFATTVHYDEPTTHSTGRGFWRERRCELRGSGERREYTVCLRLAGT